jgi:hypothetical protein
MKHFRYAKYVALHKVFVFIAGRKTGAPLWRLIIHDWSKLTPAEWGPYVETFYGAGWEHKQHGTPLPPWVEPDFDAAWLHHQHRNLHHWQSCVLRQDDGEVKALEMPEKFVREMVADWAGAGRAITGRWEIKGWYEKNRDKMVMHPNTRHLVHVLIASIW